MIEAESIQVMGDSRALVLLQGMVEYTFPLVEGECFSLDFPY